MVVYGTNDVYLLAFSIAQQETISSCSSGGALACCSDSFFPKIAIGLGPCSVSYRQMADPTAES